jgi:DNA-binding winged helix-turn-helix (wHTH) protein/TolB-like protein/tetratricopeptide (TPR) repeat protein
VSTPAPTMPAAAARCRFGLFEFDARTGELRRHGQLVKLSPQPAKVLALLLARPGDLVFRDDLRKELWGDDTFVDFERGLNFCILQVRAALGDASDNPRFVQTVPRRGYRFIAPVSSAEPLASGPRESQPRPTTVAATPSTTRSGGNGLAWWLACAAAVAVAMMGVWLVAGRSDPAAGSGAAAPIRLVVLPFVNLTGDAAADVIADGLTDELISELGQLSPRRLAVIARTSAMTYRNTAKTVAQIGRDLDVTFVVESTLRREGDGLRLGSNLIAAAQQTPVATWTETFGGSTALSSESQTGAAIRLGRLVASTLVPDASTIEPQAPTVSATAWHAYLQGRSLMGRGSIDAVRQAIAHFEEAVRDSPALAAAWAKHAEANHVLVMSGAVAPSEAYGLARTSADRALAADPSLADAHLARGLVQLWHDWNPTAAAASFERALALNGSSAAAHHDYAWALLTLGRDAEAVAEITAARDLDPLSTRANNDIGWLYLQLRQPVAAARACQHTLAVEPASLEAQACLERAYAERGLYDLALRAARATLPAAADAPRPVDNETPERSLRGVWQWRLARLEQAAARRWISPHTLAVQHALVGNREHALAHLDAAVEGRAGMLVLLPRDPSLDSLRDDPRFDALRRRITSATP